jgi:hypothetical protein
LIQWILYDAGPAEVAQSIGSKWLAGKVLQNKELLMEICGFFVEMPFCVSAKYWI